ncbi:MAG: hypothetical protein ACREPE_09060, partial [Lysobacter sp.]
AALRAFRILNDSALTGSSFWVDVLIDTAGPPLLNRQKVLPQLVRYRFALGGQWWLRPDTDCNG